MSAEGVPGLYAGLSASLARQVVYSGTRFGMYDVIKGRLHTAGEGPMPLHTKVLAALGAGACGAGAANPYDLAMVRMQADGRLAAGERRGYRNVADAVVKIGRAEGAAALWSGVAPNVNRAMIVTVGHLAVYDEAKAQLVRGGALGGDGVGVHLAAGLTSAVAASALSHPVDVAKTRLMNQRGAYRGMLHCLVMTFRNEGALALYKGFIPTLARQVPYVVVTWVTAEQVARLFRAAKA